MVASTLRTIVERGLPHLQLLLAPCGPNADEERAAAEAQLNACGAGILRLHNLLTIWNPDAYIESCYRCDWDGDGVGGVGVGGADCVDGLTPKTTVRVDARGRVS